jgi:hypothetical protein
MSILAFAKLLFILNFVQRRNKAFTLMQSFASSLNSLLCTLVQGFTEMDEFDESNERKMHHLHLNQKRNKI